MNLVQKKMHALHSFDSRIRDCMLFFLSHPQKKITFVFIALYAFFTYIHHKCNGPCEIVQFFSCVFLSLSIISICFFQLTLFKANEFTFKIEKRPNEYLEINVVHLVLLFFVRYCHWFDCCSWMLLFWLIRKIRWILVNKSVHMRWVCMIYREIFFYKL